MATPETINIVKVDFSAGNELAGVVMAATKQFSSGSKGFYGNGKVIIGGKNHQVTVQIVEIGSKPKVAKK